MRRLLDSRFQGLSRQIDQKQIDLFDRLDQLREETLRQNHEHVAGQTQVLAMLEETRAGAAAGTAATIELRHLLETQLDADIEATTIVGRALAELRSENENQTETLTQISADATRTAELANQLLERMATLGIGLDLSLIGAQIDQVDELTARFLNYAIGGSGFAAQRALWFNEPLALRYAEGDVLPASVNERIAELPWAYRAVARLKPGSTILDVGASESLLSFSLASMGYAVTAIDPRAYPLSHPNLTSVVAGVEEWESAEQFDAVLCVSTIEHIGLGAYAGSPKHGRVDLEAMNRLRSLTKPGGLLVLTTHYGLSSANWLQRTYDDEELGRLLAGWTIDELIYLRRVSPTVWIPASRNDAKYENDAIVMVTATLTDEG